MADEIQSNTLILQQIDNFPILFNQINLQNSSVTDNFVSADTTFVFTV